MPPCAVIQKLPKSFFFYLLNDAVKGSLKFVVSGSQFSEIPVSLQDGYDDLVDLVHCLIEATLLKEDSVSNEHKWMLKKTKNKKKSSLCFSRVC